MTTADIHPRRQPPRPPDGPGAVVAILRLVLWGVGAALAIGLVTAALTVVTGALALTFMLPLVMVFMALLIARTMRQVRRRQAQSVLVYVEQAVRLNLPLPAMLQAAERGEAEATWRQLAGLRTLLNQGMSLSGAMAAAVPHLPRRSLALVAAGERTGRLAPTLRRLVDQERYRRCEDVASATFYRAYPVLMLAVAGGAASIFMTFVWPKYRMIMRDFGMPAPPITAGLIDVATVWLPPVVGAALLVLLYMLARAALETFRPEWLWHDLGKRVTDHVLWHLPVAHGAARDRGLADVCGVLADAVDAGMPLGEAVEQAARLRVNEVLRGRLLEWADRLRRGEGVADAAREAGLPSMVSGMLATGGAALADVFAFLSRYYGARFSRTRALLQGAFIPAVVLAMAALVTCIALALFEPMVRLMDQVMMVSRMW